MVTIRQERPVDESAREALLDVAYGDERHGKPSAGCATAACRPRAWPSWRSSAAASSAPCGCGMSRPARPAGIAARPARGPSCRARARHRRRADARALIEAAQRSRPRRRAAGGRRRLLRPVRLLRRKDRQALRLAAQGRSGAPARARTASRTRSTGSRGRDHARLARARSDHAADARTASAARSARRITLAQKPSTAPREIRAGRYSVASKRTLNRLEFGGENGELAGSRRRSPARS